jgi:hypothetical protein
VVSDPSTPELQNCRKKVGKNPAITVVAKAELPQSYSAHDSAGRDFSQPVIAGSRESG